MILEQGEHMKIFDQFIKLTLIANDARRTALETFLHAKSIARITAPDTGMIDIGAGCSVSTPVGETFFLTDSIEDVCNALRRIESEP